MKLVIVESPSKAKTIGKYLGKDFKVLASVGHVRDLPKSNKAAIDIGAGFVPHYVVDPKKEAVIADIRKQAEKADEVLIATDPDREGEAIAWHLKELLTGKGKQNRASKKAQSDTSLVGAPQATGRGRSEFSAENSRTRRENVSAGALRADFAIPPSKIKRITYNEVTKEAVQEALEHPRDIDENLRQAQEARRVLDRIVGYDLSGLIWKKVRYGLSAGRVQSPALRIIMEREREIRAFKPEDFWVIAGDWKTEKGEALRLVCSKEPRDKTEVDSIIEAAKVNAWKVVSVEESEQKRQPRAPFITSTLQQTASTRLGFSPSRTMGIAQKLYEAGHITYMRTDSTILSKQALGQIAGVIEKDYGKEYLQFRAYAGKSKNAQEAHEAIRPTHASVKSAGHNDEQKKLYRLIWQRAVASQMADARLMRTKITANIIDKAAEELRRRASAGDSTPAETQGGKRFLASEASKNAFAAVPRRGTEGSETAKPIPDFEATGSRVIFDGWLQADPESNGEEVNLPKCAEGEPLELVSMDSLAKQTQPPPRYTEAGLIKELEKRGIGRPSTYATITRTIEDRGYVEKEGRSLKPTDTGDVVSTFLEQQFPSYISDSFTAEMEDELDDIASGKRGYEKTLSDFYKPFAKEVKAKDKLDKVTTLGEADAKFKCPKCGSPMVVKLGRNGKFLSCSRYPDCDGALTMDGHEFKKDEPIGNDPVTGLPIFVLNGRFGPYVQLGVKPEKPAKRKKGELAAPKQPKPRMASIPKGKDPSTVTVSDALKYLSLPRKLGVDLGTGQEVTASVGRFGPYVVRTNVADGKPEYRSVKPPLDIYEITLDQAIALLAIPKKKKGFARKKSSNSRY